MSTSEQARADARADAETLRDVDFMTWRGVDATPAPYEPFVVIRQEDESYWRARYAAAATFRAVPGLRG